MKIPRMTCEPSALADFYEAAFTSLGAVCGRSWHDRLRVLAEGQVAVLWPRADGVVETELHFVAPSQAGARDAGHEVFPGCPLTFGLTETLRPSPPLLERVVLAADPRNSRLPEPAVIEKLWRAQFPDTMRWSLPSPPRLDWHFSPVLWVWLETQAIDQHWSLHCLAVSLPGGGRDEPLARMISYAVLAPAAEAARVPWPTPDWTTWRPQLETVLRIEAEDELVGIRERQQVGLQRELERVDDYVARYADELSERAGRTRSEAGTLKLQERLAAARAEHARHRTDQVTRHEINVRPHGEIFLQVAEPAWLATVQLESGRTGRQVRARYVPRSRHWELLPEA